MTNPPLHTCTIVPEIINTMWFLGWTSDSGTETNQNQGYRIIFRTKYGKQQKRNANA